MGRRQSTIFEGLSPAESELRGVDSPMEFSHPRRRNRTGLVCGRGCGDAQEDGHLRKFVVAIRHPAMQVQMQMQNGHGRRSIPAAEKMG